MTPGLLATDALLAFAAGSVLRVAFGVVAIALFATLVLCDRRFPPDERVSLLWVWLVYLVVGAWRAAMTHTPWPEVVLQVGLLYAWTTVATAFRPAVATAYGLSLYLPEGDHGRFKPPGRQEKFAAHAGRGS